MFVTAGTSWFSREAVPCCTGAVAYSHRHPLVTDLENLAAACAVTPPVEAFMNAASPGVLTKFVPDRYYQDEDAYVEALANALKEEYEAIVKAGFILQIDAPDLGSARHNQYQHLSDEEFLRIAERNIAALNHATANIPPEAMRMHLCWGNYEGPHTHDIALAKIFDVCMRARPAGLSFEAANPRHAHEWEDLRAADLPLRRYRRAGAGDRRRRLRLCDLRLRQQRRGPLGRLGQARRPRRRCQGRDRAAVGLIPSAGPVPAVRAFMSLGAAGSEEVGGRTRSGQGDQSALQTTLPSPARRNTTPGVAPVCFASSTTTTPLTITIVRLPVGYWCGAA